MLLCTSEYAKWRNRSHFWKLYQNQSREVRLFYPSLCWNFSRKSHPSHRNCSDVGRDTRSNLMLLYNWKLEFVGSAELQRQQSFVVSIEWKNSKLKRSFTNRNLHLSQTPNKPANSNGWTLINGADWRAIPNKWALPMSQSLQPHRFVLPTWERLWRRQALAG